MKIRAVWALSTALSALIAGCAAETIPLAKTADVETDTLTGVTWYLKAYGPAAAPSPLLPGTESTLLLDSHMRQASGLAGCNRFTGSFAVSGDKVNIGQLAMTKRMCVEPEGLAAQESTVAAALSSASRYAFENGALLLYYGADGVLRYSRVAAPETEAPTLTSLRVHLGEYPRDVDLWEHPFLARRLQSLLGDSYGAFLENLRVQGPLSEENGLLFVTGNKPHEGGSHMATFTADPATDKIQVWLAVGGKVKDFSEAEPPLADPPSVAAFKANLKPAP